MIPCKIIGLQLIGVMQLAYFALAQQENINILLESFTKLNQINGMNLNLVSENKQMPDQIESLGIKALFLNNCNVMLLVIVSNVVIAGALYGLAHLLKNFSQKLSSFSKYLIKQGLLTLIMFNAFNIAFGIGVHFQYADKNNQAYLLSSIAAVLSGGLIFVTCILITFTSAKQFGEFKNKFKKDFMSQSYFVFTLAYRYGLGFYIATQAEYFNSSLIVIAFSMAFLCYNLTNLPYKDAYHNYRANFCHITQFVILLVTNYYDGMKANDTIDQKARYYDAAQIQIAAIYTTLGVSMICLGVEIYKFVKTTFMAKPKKSFKSSKNKPLKPQSNETNQNLEIQNIYQNTEIIFQDLQ